MIFPAQGTAFGGGTQELHFAGGQGQPAAQVTGIQPEMRIADQQRAKAAGKLFHGFPADGEGIDVGNGNCLLNVQLTGPAVLSDPAPVPETVGEVTGLLDFVAPDAGSQGMHCSGGDIEHISRVNLCAAQAAFQLSCIQDGPQGLSAGVDSVHQLSPGRSVQDIPCLTLAELAFMGEGIAVIGMDLDRERLTGVQKLQQQRSGIFPRGNASPAAFCRHTPRRKHGFPVRAGRKLPGFHR